MKKTIAIIGLLGVSAFSLASTTPAHGASYGSGTYGAGAYGVGLLPTLTFSVTGLPAATTCNGHSTSAVATSTGINFGRQAVAADVSAAQQVTVDTNAAGGYTVYVSSATPLNSAGDSLSTVQGTNAAPGAFAAASGTEAVGYTTDDSALGTGTVNRFTAGGPLWAALASTPGEVMYSNVATSPGASQCVNYRVVTSAQTTAGAYSATVVYQAVPIF